MHREEMHLETGMLTQEEANEYLVNLQDLASEVDRAMEAIVQRELPVLQNSVHLQQTKCIRLADLGHVSNSRISGRADDVVDPVDPDLATEIKAAATTLLELNKRYSALLKHSGDTLRLLAGLFRSYHGSAKSASGAQANLHTWSCEL